MSINRVTITATLYNSVLQNVLHFYISGQTTPDLPALLVNIRDHWLDVYRNLYVAETVFVSLHGEVIATGGGGQVENLLLSMTGGAGNDVRVPLMQALVIQLRTGLGGRRFRGRIFVGGQSSAFTQNGLFTGAYLATVSPILATLVDRWCITPSYGANLVIWHRPGDTIGDTTDVTTMQARATPGCQRRRELGIGI